MLSVLMITAFLLRVERGGGALILKRGLIKNFNLQMGGGLIREAGLIRAFTVSLENYET